MQGFNMGRYVPPDQEGLISGNQLHGKHALGARANKISQGILTVRFEMPYPIWCTHCPKPTIIGQGVRFNAEKKKIGYYYSTPIYSFRMKHVACSGWIEIRTDPKNTAYVVTEGARKRDLGEDKVEDGDLKIMTQEEREKLRSDAFASLEGKVEDKQRLDHSKKRLEELEDLSEQQWDDPYEKNKKLRDSFRVGRKKREKEAFATAALQDKMSLGLELLPETEEDVRRAGYVDFGETGTEITLSKAIKKPLFAKDPVAKPKPKGSKVSKRQKAAIEAKKRTDKLVAEIQGNTRVAMDPFLAGFKSSNGASMRGGSKQLLTGVKRKQPEGEMHTGKNIPSGLVDYDTE